jgi:hypothetical protein
MKKLAIYLTTLYTTVKKRLNKKRCTKTAS